MSRVIVRSPRDRPARRPPPVCGYPAICGRPPGHRAHHGGWTTQIDGVIPRPYAHAARGPLGAALSPNQVALLAEIVRHGVTQDAADALGISLRSAKHQLTVIHAKTGASTTIEALAAIGWLTVPQEYQRV